jgi:hypothetical protein
MLAESVPVAADLGPRLMDHLTHISQWADENNLEIAPAKFYVTLFTSWNRVANFHPQVFVDGQLILLNKRPKHLGINQCSSYAPTPQIESSMAVGNKGVQYLKAISGQAWGDKETLLMTYKTIIKPGMIHSAPIWYPNVDPNSSAMTQLQAIQNSLLHVISGAHKTADRDHLLAECGVLSMNDQLGFHALNSWQAPPAETIRHTT